MAFYKIQKIALIGAGKLATNFAFTMKKKGLTILQVYNRSRESGMKLAEKVSSSYIDDLRELSDKADLYALAVSDSALQEISDKIHLRNQMIIHFSGTAEISILKGTSSNYGVLYPPQTFTLRQPTGFLNIPLCVEANNSYSERKLSAFAATLSDKTFKVSTSQRKTIHLSAIFASNFTNFMYSIAEDLLTGSNLPMTLLEPIIEKTKANAMRKNIFNLQTGPAVREDFEMIKTHLDLLSKKPEFKEIYRLLSECIINYKHQNQNDKL
jgi:predicted short-subunit dehydrogenase-like oxidoreductase (DUF2520 family)